MDQSKLTETEIQYLKEDKYLKAIMAYSQRTGTKLMDAKDIIDSWLEFENAFERKLNNQEEG